MFRVGIGKLQVVYMYVCVSERDLRYVLVVKRECRTLSRGF